MREAMRVHRDPLEIDLVLAQRALDGGPGLPMIENDRLVVNNPPSVEHVGICPGGIGASARIDTGRPKMTGGLQAHHVSRGMESLAQSETIGAARRYRRTIPFACRS